MLDIGYKSKPENFTVFIRETCPKKGDEIMNHSYES